MASVTLDKKPLPVKASRREKSPWRLPQAVSLTAKQWEVAQGRSLVGSEALRRQGCGPAGRFQALCDVDLPQACFSGLAGTRDT